MAMVLVVIDVEGGRAATSEALEGKKGRGRGGEPLLVVNPRGRYPAKGLPSGTEGRKKRRRIVSGRNTFFLKKKKKT